MKKIIFLILICFTFVSVSQALVVKQVNNLNPTTTETAVSVTSTTASSVTRNASRVQVSIQNVGSTAFYVGVSTNPATHGKLVNPSQEYVEDNSKEVIYMLAAPGVATGSARIQEQTR